ncbi:MAG TPA: hypothetical protein VGV92_07500 [Gammaproteobacteria bacterium]|nr:hypothetical protein [Gammaproteobacteria bacterium]
MEDTSKEVVKVVVVGNLNTMMPLAPRLFGDAFNPDFMTYACFHFDRKSFEASVKSEKSVRVANEDFVLESFDTLAEQGKEAVLALTFDVSNKQTIQNMRTYLSVLKSNNKLDALTNAPIIFVGLGEVSKTQETEIEKIAAAFGFTRFTIATASVEKGIDHFQQKTCELLGIPDSKAEARKQKQEAAERQQQEQVESAKRVREELLRKLKKSPGRSESPPAAAPVQVVEATVEVQAGPASERGNVVAAPAMIAVAAVEKESWLKKKYLEAKHSRKALAQELDICLAANPIDETWLLMIMDSVDERDSQTSLRIEEYFAKIGCNYQPTLDQSYKEYIDSNEVLRNSVLDFIADKKRPRGGVVISLLRLLDDEDTAKGTKFLNFFGLGADYVAEQERIRQVTLDVAKNCYTYHKAQKAKASNSNDVSNDNNSDVNRQDIYGKYTDDEIPDAVRKIVGQALPQFGVKAKKLEATK